MLFVIILKFILKFGIKVENSDSYKKIPVYLISDVYV